MKKLTVSLAVVFCVTGISAQETGSSVSLQEQQLESIAENNTETGDDEYAEELARFLKDPVNLNIADARLLESLKLLSPVQVQNLVSYRKLLGNLLGIYELQAVPGWDIETIRKLRPYITVKNTIDLYTSLRNRLKGGEHSLLLRVSRMLEESQGYNKSSAPSSGSYAGSPMKFLLRYKYQYKNMLQFGFVAEKDPGEQFFKGNQKAGFDFYTGHVFIRDYGIIKALALGDFVVNMGQGLIQWQGMAFKKSAEILSVKRQSPVLKPFHSAGEYNFHRGVALTVGKEAWQATVFASSRNLDANFKAADTLGNEALISSFQTSGLHRTKNETEEKGIQKQLAFGGNISFRLNKLQLGVNAVQYAFKYPLLKDPRPDNRYALSGKKMGNYSLDYAVTVRNMHFFGELAFANNNAKALVSGLLISLAGNADLGLLYRNISEKYQALYSNAFTENTSPSNEKGLFTGISIRPGPGWQLDAYADLYKFPWLRYGVNFPSTGSDYAVQFMYRPNKQLEISCRYKRSLKENNEPGSGAPMHQVVGNGFQSWRTQLLYKINHQITARCRVEMSVYNAGFEKPSRGYLLYADLLYKPLLRPLSGSIRLQYFETDDYNSRIYAYENDVLFSYSIPVFYQKGYRYYLNMNYDFKRLSAWLKIAQTIYPDLKSIGSGADLINGNRKTEIKLQLMYRF